MAGLGDWIVCLHEYLSLTETRCKIADPDNDGKLYAKEGQLLLKLLQ
jgi:hypothetical protein